LLICWRPLTISRAVSETDNLRFKAAQFIGDAMKGKGGDGSFPEAVFGKGTASGQEKFLPNSGKIQFFCPSGEDRPGKICFMLRLSVSGHQTCSIMCLCVT
jgi:hypothetical protein